MLRASEGVESSAVAAMSGCDGHSHDHEHSEPDDTNTSLGTSLRPSIDFSNVRCLNESRPGAGRDILKLYDERWTSDPKLLSQEDHEEEPELLLVLPFTEAVSIKSLCVLSHAGNSAMTTNNNNTNITAPPRTVRIFVNRPNLDLDDCRDLEPDAEIILVPPTHQWSEEHASGTIDYMLRPAGRFANVSEVALYFPDNYYDMEQEQQQQQQQQQQSFIFVQTEITYIMFKGRGTNVKRRAVEAVYEICGMTKDHKTPGAEYFGKMGL